MFTKNLYNVNAQVTLELDPALSHKVLQENREGLVWKAKRDNGQAFYPENELNRFVEGLIVNPRSVKPANKTTIEFIKGNKRALPVLTPQFETGGAALNAHSSTITFKNPPIVVSDSVQSLIATGLTMEQIVESIDSGELIANRLGRPLQLRSGEWVWEGEATLPDDVRLEWKPNTTTIGDGQAQVIGIDNVPDPKAEAFTAIFPFDYVVKHESKRPAPHTKHARVLAAWKKLLHILSLELDIRSDFGVGLCIDQESKAELVETPYGDFFLIDYKEFKSTGGQLPQTMKMIRLAAHELTHAKGYEDHNEAFIVEESRVFDVAMENLQALRAATKGLTVYSRYTGSNRPVN